MFADLEQFDSGRTMRFDLCVVGAGPAGISVVNELIGSGFKVCLVESGGFKDEAETQSLYKGECLGHPMALDEGRCRIFGGSGTQWGGRSAMLDPIDFEHREWVKNSGWPITRKEIEPYYERSKKSGNFREPWISTSEVQSLGIKLPDLTPEGIDPFIWRVASPDLQKSLLTWIELSYCKNFDWGRAYRSRLKADADTFVLLHANLSSFQDAGDGSGIKSIAVTSLSGVSMTIEAKLFTLACSGIENIRLLLNAPPAILKQVNRFDNLGRYFAQHPRGRIATIDADAETSINLQRLYNIFLRPRRAKIQYETGFALSEREQREHRLLNASAFIQYDAGPETPWKAGRRLRDALKTGEFKPVPFLQDVGHVVGGVGDVIPNFVRRYLLGHEVIHRKPLIEIIIDLEQEPNPDSRITLSSDKDALGMRRARVDWRIGEPEIRTARYFSRRIAQGLERLGFGRVNEAAWLKADAPPSEMDLKGTFHFIGGTRMSKSPRDGVVDEQCRTHGLENLYLAGTSVFTTGGHANPTLTIVALAIRLADHLHQQLRKPDPGRVLVSEAGGRPLELTE
jgi:choline dehydrogenase-like flavoprotein